jgi:hypothetical protein
MNSLVQPGRPASFGHHHCIELSLSFNAFPILAGFFPPTLYFTLCVLFFMEGRFAGYLPTISETGTEYPNNHFMPIAFATVTASIFFSGVGFYWYLVTFFPTNNVSRFLLAFSVLAGMSGFIALSNCPVNVNARNHFLSAFIGLGGILLIQFVCWWIVSPTLRLAAKVAQLALVLLQIAALAVVGFTEAIVRDRLRITLAAVGEYTILALLPVFYLSFSRDLCRVDQLLLALDEPANGRGS